jgi:epoxyqueuosine reductase
MPGASTPDRARLAWRIDYMLRHGSKRHRPEELLPGTLSVLSARMNYWPNDSADD